jgi:hypothetical protein
MISPAELSCSKRLLGGDEVPFLSPCTPANEMKLVPPIGPITSGGGLTPMRGLFLRHLEINAILAAYK